MPGKKRKISEGSFHVEQEARIAAPRDKVFDALCDVGGWWCHHFAEGSPKITLEPRVGGLFQEHWGDGEGALWGVVTYVKRPEVLRLTGPLGMDTPVSSVYEFRLDERKGGTVLRLTHRCVGLIDRKWRRAHDKGWGELRKRLKAFVEKGEKYQG
jgi:uncharacterized protein YndB with AHSA1/START domain